MFLPTLIVVYAIIILAAFLYFKRQDQKESAVAKRKLMTGEERKKQREKEKEQGEMFGCLMWLPLIALIVIFWNASTVTTVYKKNGEWAHKSGHYVGWYTYTDRYGDKSRIPIRTFGKDYIYNESSTELVFFNVGYGSKSKTPLDVYNLPSWDITEVIESPSYYFSYPMSIRSKTSGTVRWVVYDKSKYLERRREGRL